MTPEEIRQTLFRTLDKLDELYGDRTNAEELLRSEREAHRQEVNNLNAAMSAKDKKIAEKDARIAALEKELAQSKASNVDANHKVESANQEKFCGTSKRGIDKKHNTRKGRDDDRDDFDGTAGSAVPQENAPSQSSNDVEAISRSHSDIKKEQAMTRGKYDLADATEKIVYQCDDSLLPEGAVVTGHSQEVVFDEEHIIRARIYKMVTYRIRVPFTNEDGQEDWRVEEHTVHVRRRGATEAPGTLRDASSDESAPDCQPRQTGGEEEIIVYENGHMPGQITDTKVSDRMLAMLILQHLDAHVPVNRLTHLFDEFGLDIDRSTVGGWLGKAADMMEDVYGKLLDQILTDGSVCYCDETWGRLHLKEITGKVYTWIIGNRKAKAVAYYYDDGSRGRNVLVDLLKDRNIKAMHTDGYTAYYYLKELNIDQICCGAHVWRKIKEWYERTNDPEAKLLLLDLQWLFIQEAELKETGAPPAEVLRRRNSTQTIEVITRFGARLEKLKLNIDRLPKKGQTAVNYALNMQSRVFRWREDADYELDNNWCERAARPYALSRKTSMFTCSHRGAKVRAILRSFVETCKLEGISIVNYFTSFFRAVCNGRTDYENLLPATINLNA